MSGRTDETASSKIRQRKNKITGRKCVFSDASYADEIEVPCGLTVTNYIGYDESGLSHFA